MAGTGPAARAGASLAACALFRGASPCSRGDARGKNFFALTAFAALFLLSGPATVTAQNAAQNLAAPAAPAAETVTGKGVVKAIDTEDRQIRIAHEAIKALDWPAMTMAFKLGPGVDMGALAPGMKVTFTLSKSPKGYVIERIERAD
ncbi:copper-binding protein [Methylocystis sp. IM2]|uniref:copper-binding protein n=1 Tax=unclassified Methylocystis TaxID=2625913 RepID=UPI0030F59BEE